MKIDCISCGNEFDSKDKFGKGIFFLINYYILSKRKKNPLTKIQCQECETFMKDAKDYNTKIIQESFRKERERFYNEVKESKNKVPFGFTPSQAQIPQAEMERMVQQAMTEVEEEGKEKKKKPAVYIG